MLAGVVATLTAIGGQGADLLWGVALGDRIRAGDGVPQTIPFAASSTAGWANPMALGESLLSLVHSAGPSALMVFHLLLVTATLALLVTTAIGEHHRDGRTAVALSITAVGSLTTLAIARMPSLSLVPYALLVVLLLRESKRPTWRLWLAVPLLVFWGNLHGGVLVGCALLGVHLVFCHGSILRRAVVGATSFAVVLLTTSAGWRTIVYYRGALNNEAARQHTGLWATPNPHNPFDVLMILAAVSLIAMWLRGRPRRWEVVAVAGMSLATLIATRNGIWLVLLLLPLAGRGLPRAGSSESRTFPWGPTAVAMALLITGAGWQIVSRGSALYAHGSAAVPTVRRMADGRTVLAIEPYEETFAQAGIRIWAGDPIDAFSKHTQREYLAFVNEGAIPTTPSVGLIVVDKRLAGPVTSAGWRQIASVSNLLVFERAPAALPILARG